MTDLIKILPGLAASRVWWLGAQISS